MDVFQEYSAYYDLLNKDKEYQLEAEYLDKLIKKLKPDAKTILDLGCGTGKHDALLAELGYHVKGVDLSENMLNIAKGTYGENDNLSFTCADIRDLNLNIRFDVVTSLFHVMSYQTRNLDVEKAMATACNHLGPGGLFLFDCWYGPAVLTIKPETRMKAFEDNKIKVIRFAVPEIHYNENVVDVNYTILISDLTAQKTSEFHEKHRMRYFFKPEIDSFLERGGFVLKDSFEYMTQRESGPDTWGVCFVAQKK